ncbi:hypothetical protein, partial [Nocardia salmonicida]|uniref:hypothetical protein n=1 Tax=Nocardia salmonicida TaxID=53431 RepID=UPI0033E13CAD
MKRRRFLPSDLFNSQNGDPDMTIVPIHPDDQPTAPAPVTPPVRSFPDIPRQDIALSLATNAPIPREWLPQVSALVREQQRIGTEREADELSQMEALVTSKGMLAAEEAREHGAEELATLVEQAGGIRAEISTLRGELGRIDKLPITGTDGEVVTVSIGAAAGVGDNRDGLPIGRPERMSQCPSRIRKSS